MRFLFVVLGSSVVVLVVVVGIVVVVDSSKVSLERIDEGVFLCRMISLRFMKFGLEKFTLGAFRVSRVSSSSGSMRDSIASSIGF